MKFLFYLPRIKGNQCQMKLALKSITSKTLLLLFMGFGLSLDHSQAQKIDLQTIGVKGGVNTFSLSGNDITGTNTLLGLHLGAYAEIPVLETLSIKPELLYTLNRWKHSNANTVHANWAYLDIPVMVNLKVDQITEGLSVHAGPQLGFLLSARRKGTSSGGNEIDDDRKDSVKNSNFSLGFGAGYALPSGIQFTLRYLIGLSKVGIDPEDGYVFDVKSGSFQVGAAYPIFNK